MTEKDGKQIIPEDEWLKCPDCNNQGIVAIKATYDSEDVDFEPCEWCHRAPDSVFNQLQMLE